MKKVEETIKKVVEEVVQEMNSIGAGGVSATGGSPLGQDMGPTHEEMWSGNLEEKRKTSPMATPIIAYHGTTSKFLPTIVNHGLSPRKEDKKNVWQDEEQDFLDSLPGVYMTTNVHTAANYAKEAVSKFGGNPLVFAIQAVPQSAFADEDNLDFTTLFQTMVFERDLLRQLIFFYLTENMGEYNKIKYEFADKAHHRFLSNIPEGKPKPQINLNLLGQIFDLMFLKWGTKLNRANFSSLVELLFQSGKFNTEQETEMFVRDKLDDMRHEYSEATMKQLQDALTKYYAINTRSKGFMASEFRIDQTIGFSGRNKIVGIAEERKTVKDNFSYPVKQWVMLYGKPYRIEDLSSKTDLTKQVPEWEMRARQLRQQRQQQNPQQFQQESLSVLTDQIMENVLDKMGLKKATSQVRRDVIGGSPVYMDRHDGDKEGTKKVMAQVSQNLNKKPYSKNPPMMGIEPKKKA